MIPAVANLFQPTTAPPAAPAAVIPSVIPAVANLFKAQHANMTPAAAAPCTAVASLFQAHAAQQAVTLQWSGGLLVPSILPAAC